jgi:mRNA-degrading endonuclease RelE of RelBE toxin-antitoxin system
MAENPGMAHFDVRVSPRAQAQLNLLRAFDHVRIIEAIEENLAYEPLVRSRNRKPLEPTPTVLADLFRSFLGDATVWELRVTPWRVAYAVEGQMVHVLFVFRKDRGTTDNALS